MSSRLVFIGEGDYPTEYELDRMAADILDQRQNNPDARVWDNMPSRDRAIAVAMMRLALKVLDTEDRLT